MYSCYAFNNSAGLDPLQKTNPLIMLFDITLMWNYYKNVEMQNSITGLIFLHTCKRAGGQYQSTEHTSSSIGLGY